VPWETQHFIHVCICIAFVLFVIIQPVAGRAMASPGLSRAAGVPTERIWEMSQPVIVQGGSLKTWSFPSPYVERVQIVMRTDGRPLDANLELWQGPDNTPYKMRIYVEDGQARTFSAVIETPREEQNTISIRNTAQLEFPLVAGVVSEDIRGGPPLGQRVISERPQTIQGGALRTYPFNPSVESVQVMMTTDGRPLNARIELLQGPNNIKQVMEVYTEDGLERPFYAVIETPGTGNVVRVVNTASMEFPMTAAVEAFEVGDGRYYGDGILLGGMM
jgi:hypothetical protein